MIQVYKKLPGNDIVKIYPYAYSVGMNVIFDIRMDSFRLGHYTPSTEPGEEIVDEIITSNMFRAINAIKARINAFDKERAFEADPCDIEYHIDVNGYQTFLYRIRKIYQPDNVNQFFNHISNLVARKIRAFVIGDKEHKIVSVVSKFNSPAQRRQSDLGLEVQMRNFDTALTNILNMISGQHTKYPSGVLDDMMNDDLSEWDAIQRWKDNINQLKTHQDKLRMHMNDIHNILIECYLTKCDRTGNWKNNAFGKISYICSNAFDQAVMADDIVEYLTGRGAFRIHTNTWELYAKLAKNMLENMTA